MLSSFHSFLVVFSRSIVGLSFRGALRFHFLIYLMPLAIIFTFFDTLPLLYCFAFLEIYFDYDILRFYYIDFALAFSGESAAPLSQNAE